LKTRFVLTIDGGGVRGIVAAVLLDALEGELRNAGVTKPVSDVFDLIAGTSTGAIIASGLSAPGPDPSKPLFTPTQLRDLFRNHVRDIFPRRRILKVPILRNIRQLLGPLYSPTPLQSILTQSLGNKTFLNPRRNLLITAYSIDPREAVFFRGGPLTPPGDPQCSGDIKLVDAVIGSSAAPTFFPPHIVTNARSGKRNTLIDGAVFNNNPAIAGLAEALRLFPDDDIKVISLGTGRTVQSFPFAKASRWGFLEWVTPIGEFRTPLLSVIADGQAHAVEVQMEKLLGDRFQRFDYNLNRGYGAPSIDDSSKSNMRALERGALNMVEEMRPRLRTLAQEIAWVQGQGKPIASKRK